MYMNADGERETHPIRIISVLWFLYWAVSRFVLVSGFIFSFVCCKIVILTLFVLLFVFVFLFLFLFLFPLLFGIVSNVWFRLRFNFRFLCLVVGEFFSSLFLLVGSIIRCSVMKAVRSGGGGIDVNGGVFEAKGQRERYRQLLQWCHRRG